VVTLLDKHHYVRFCKPSQIDEGKVLSVAFMLREQDTDGLSGDHFEHYTNNNYQQILESLTKRFRAKPSKNACFAKLNCGEVVNSAKEIYAISFLKGDEEQSHTLMTGFLPGDDMMPVLLATLIKETIPINSI
jgi:hypothetical protein